MFYPIRIKISKHKEVDTNFWKNLRRDIFISTESKLLVLEEIFETGGLLFENENDEIFEKATNKSEINLTQIKSKKLKFSKNQKIFLFITTIGFKT